MSPFKEETEVSSCGSCALFGRYIIAVALPPCSSAAFSEDQISLEVTYENVGHSDEFQLIKEMAVEGKSHLEMADARGISVVACKKRVQRAKEFLRRNI